MANTNSMINMLLMKLSKKYKVTYIPLTFYDDYKKTRKLTVMLENKKTLEKEKREYSSVTSMLQDLSKIEG